MWSDQVHTVLKWREDILLNERIEDTLVRKTSVNLKLGTVSSFKTYSPYFHFEWWEKARRGAIIPTNRTRQITSIIISTIDYRKEKSQRDHYIQESVGGIVDNQFDWVHEVWRKCKGVEQRVVSVRWSIKGKCKKKWRGLVSIKGRLLYSPIHVRTPPWKSHQWVWNRLRNEE